MKYKVEIGLVKTERAEIEYVRFGVGRKNFVMIPGLSIKSLVTSAGSVARAYEQFCEDYTVYMILPRKNIMAGLSLRDMADDIASVMKELEIYDAYVMGTSMGGMLAQILAINYPTYVKKLVLCSSASRMNEASLGVMNKFIALAKKNDAAALCGEFVDYVYSEKFAGRFRELLIEMHKDTTEDELSRFIVLTSACETLNTYDELEKIKCPLFVIGSKGDRVLTGEASEEIAEKTGCEIYMYDETFSHAAYDEAEDYKDRIQKFFDKE